MKKWNWYMFLAMMGVSILGSLYHRHTETPTVAIIIGILFGVPFGLIWAYILRKQ